LAKEREKTHPSIGSVGDFKADFIFEKPDNISHLFTIQSSLYDLVHLVHSSPLQVLRDM